MSEGSSFSTFLPALVVICLFELWLLVRVKSYKYFLDLLLTHLGVLDNSVLRFPRAIKLRLVTDFYLHCYVFNPRASWCTAAGPSTLQHVSLLRCKPQVCSGVLIFTVFCSRCSKPVCFYIAESLMVAFVGKDSGFYWPHWPSSVTLKLF